MPHQCILLLGLLLGGRKECVSHDTATSLAGGSHRFGGVQCGAEFFCFGEEVQDVGLEHIADLIVRVAKYRSVSDRE